MERQSRELKEWWSSPEEQQLAIAQLRLAIDKYENEKKNRKINEPEEKMVDVDIQKVIAGMTRPILVGDKFGTQEGLEKLLLEYNENIECEKK